MDEASASRGRALLREGRLDEALAEFLGLTREQPDRAEFWYLCSITHAQLRQFANARADVERALALEPDRAHFRLHAGRVAEDQGDFARAVREFRRATELEPGWALAWSNLGAALQEAERIPEAVEALACATDLDPKLARAWNNLGLALAALDRPSEATRAFERALAIDPRHALARFNLARLANNAGDTEGALAQAMDATRLDARLMDAHLLVGDLYRKRQELERAAASYRNAVAAAPHNPKARNALAELHWEAGSVDEARREFEATLTRHPGNLRAALGARLTLPAVYDGPEHLEDCRRRYRAGLEELLADPGRFSKSRPADLLSEARWTNFYLAYQGHDDRDLQSLYGDFMHRVLTIAAPDLLAPRAPRSRNGGRIRVGFVSYFFYGCTAGRYFASWVRGLDAGRFERFVYYTNAHADDDTRGISTAADHFRHLPGRSLTALAQHVLADELDVLVYPELGMHQDTFALASLRLAPVQCAGWGHPTTTGLPTIDWFLSSEAMEPPGAQAAYRERLALLPGLGTRYERPSGEEPGTRADFGLPADKHLYLVPQSVFKIHPDNDALIAEVLANDPQGVAVMFAAGPHALIDRFVRRLKPIFAAHGLATDRHLVFLPYLSHAAYLGVNRECDVMLDTLHWSGGNASLDAIAMGLPVVTLPGGLMRGRQSLGMLRILGQEALVAGDAADYVRLATGIAMDHARREATSQALRENAGRLFGQGAPVEAMADFLERVARGAVP
ncbi:MAG: tetratricopeptide repeat protein [Betaproteobacteria bacterium]|nr:tetratricopeptide repeat protein [Betaproteobacteria bacterium]